MVLVTLDALSPSGQIVIGGKKDAPETRGMVKTVRPDRE